MLDEGSGREFFSLIFAAAQGLRLKIDCSLFINIYIGEPAPGGGLYSFIPPSAVFCVEFSIKRVGVA